MSLRRAINQTLNRFGYSIIREETFNRLTQQRSRGSVAPPETRPSPETPPSLGPASERLANPEKSRRLTLRSVANRPPRFCNAYTDPSAADRLSGWVRDKVREFQANGVAVVETNRDQALRWSETEVFDRDVSNLHSSWDWAGNSVNSYGGDLRTGMPSQALQDELLELFSQSDFEQFFRGVLGCSIDISNCRLVRSQPHSGVGIGPQSWHEDGCPSGIIRGVLYLTDVDETNGPFQYKDAANVAHTITGKAGDLLIFDAMKLPHRAMPPVSRERMAIDLVFMPRLADAKMRVISAGMNHWPSDPFIFDVPTDKSEFRKVP
jgi:hypothetical protein